MWTIFHTEASLGWGGQEIRILNESLGMIARGHRVVIIAQDDSEILGRARARGVETLEVSFRKKDYPKTFRAFKKAIREYRPDIINTHSSRDSWLATLASRASVKRTVVIRTRHISTPVSTSLTSSLIYRVLPDMIVTTAEAIKDRLVRVNRVDPAMVVSIPTGVDLSIYDPSMETADLREELSLPPGTPLVAMVAVLRSWKGHDYFLDAAAKVSRSFPEARFLVVGDGPRRESITALIAEKGLENTVLMLGHRNDVPSLLTSFDVFVQPSYANEGIPQSVIQAMAMEVPVVATALEPFKELVTDGETGLLVPAKDSGALAAGIERLLADPELGRRLAGAARGRVLERFTIDRMLDDTESLYKRLLG